ncbi:MAG: malto-oligosyltrehalose synthase [Dehalococcoidia bacterium]
MGAPLATYRIQVTPDFKFGDVRAVLGYLSDLGISDLYTSPLFEAKPGSQHGYDVTDPGRIRGELGGADEFRSLAAELRSHGMGLLLDIVPNHTAATADNPWWSDVLEHGPTSPFNQYFDIDWLADREGRLVLPVMGQPLDDVIAAGEMTLDIDRAGLWLRYYDSHFPLEVRSYSHVLKACLQPGAHSELVSLAGEIESMPDWRSAGPGASERHGLALELKQRFLSLLEADDGQIRHEIEARADDTALLKSVAEAQPYRLEYWRDGLLKINYRRFFDINDLAGIRAEEPAVFDASHRLVLDLVADGTVTGLRIDHIDGLWDPKGYLDRLAAALPADLPDRSGIYLVTEKILSADEELPHDWVADGTTGYEFMNAVNGICVDPAGLASLKQLHSEITGEERSFERVVYDKKLQVIGDLFRSELGRLVRELEGLAASDSAGAGLSVEDLSAAVSHVTAALEVYRTYTRTAVISAHDRGRIQHSVEVARERQPGLTSAIDFLSRVLLLRFSSDMTAEDRDAWVGFVMRWQQFTGPVMAKGAEDTALYTYVPLISLNDVGGDPDGAFAGVDAIHELNERRADEFPVSLNGTSTHDTKRSEDVRARIDVLSEVPDEWAGLLKKWRGMSGVQNVAFENAAAELLVYQTLAGAWPLHEEERPAFVERLKAYMTKASREAKTHSSWLDPNEEYEQSISEFIDQLLTGPAASEFMDTFLPFQARIAYYGALNSLAQVTVKAASPGAPDFYQGSEMWDFSMVDPDNRRPVDYDLRRRSLAEIQKATKTSLAGFASKLLSTWRDGRVKLFVTHAALRARRDNPEVFESGRYIPLSGSGRYSNHVFGFARRAGDRWAIAAVPRLTVSLCDVDEAPIGAAAWEDTAITLPEDAPSSWVNVFTGDEASHDSDYTALRMADVFSTFPFALLVGDTRAG